MPYIVILLYCCIIRKVFFHYGVSVVYCCGENQAISCNVTLKGDMHVTNIIIVVLITGW